MGAALTEETRRVLDAVAGVLLMCFLLLVAAQLFVWVVLYLAGDPIYGMYSSLFDIPRKEYDLFLLYSLTFMKVLNVVFFMVPFAAIKLVLRGRT